MEARLVSPMKENDGRQDYVRATLETAADGSRVATPFAKQDSSMQRTFALSHAADRPASHAPRRKSG